MILETIGKASQERVASAKKNVSLEEMERLAFSMPPEEPFRFEKALKKEKGLAFICEIKKASPSKGIISENFPYEDIALDYEKAGADALSVLTEPYYFKGSGRHLENIRKRVSLPILRKDFIVDEYQIYEARVLGAQGVLLICGLLEPASLKKYMGICRGLGLSALTEAHTENEVIQALEAEARIIGVNNRDLRTFQVDADNCLRLRPLVPDDVIFVAESGIKTRDDVIKLEDHGVDAVLIGEFLMKSVDKSAALKSLKGF